MKNLFPFPSSSERTSHRGGLTSRPSFLKLLAGEIPDDNNSCSGMDKRMAVRHPLD